MEEQEIIDFKARDGINCNSLNANFELVRTQANNNETKLTQIANTALKKDGSNIQQSAIEKFQQTETNVLEWAESISLADNSTNILEPSGNTTIVLPDVPADEFSHTIILIVQGSSYTLSAQTVDGIPVEKHLLNGLNIDTTKTYSLMYIYNKLDNSWYYSLTQ